jgi:anti-anti-sigma factor
VGFVPFSHGTPGRAPGTAQATHLQGRIWVVTLHGEHDLSSRRALTDALLSPERSDVVVVDLSDAAFIDSAVVAAIIQAQRRCSDGGGLLLAVVPPGTFAHRVFGITGITAVLNSHETRDGALHAIPERLR